MKKKIIEKLELPYDDGKGYFSSGSGEIHILRKVNEIIDVLNSWVFEPTLTIPSQSQKQPSGWIETDRWEKAKPVWTKKNQEQFEALIKKANPDEKDKSVHDKLSKLLKEEK